MIDYSQWSRKSVPVSNLQLDPENPRIPPTDDDLSQDDLLAELIEHDNVYPLAKKIATNGYYADELLIVTQTGSSYIVLEGNRRLAALKALLSPDAAPPKHQKKFRALEKGLQKSLIKSVGVIIAPSRDVALPRIAEKHTRSMLEHWKPAQKARFYTSLVQDGRPHEQICKDFDLTQGQLDEFLRLGTLYQMACSLKLPEAIQQKVENPRSFLLTNLERFVESSQGQKFLGMKPDAQSVFKGEVKVAEFKKGFTKVVTDVAIGGKDGIDSRVLHDSKSIGEYVKRIKAHEPDKSKKGSFTPKSIIRTPSQPAVSAAKPKKKTTRRASNRLIPTDLKCGVSDQRINHVFNELIQLQRKPDDFPNAIAIMLRVLLDLSVSHYIKQSKQTPALIKRFNKEGKRPRDWHPSLRQQLQFMTEDLILPLEPLELKAVIQFAQKKSEQMALDELDGFVHNKYMQPGESDLRSICTKIVPLLRITLNEP